MQPSFVRNLDSGMRRLGYLEVLICDCIIKGEQTSGKYLGESLWSWAKENQPEFLDKIGKNRKLNREEVGKITEKTASRYVKYATEIGLLTKGTEKELTDAGRLFQNYRKHRFMIENNPGQQILLLDALLTKDKLIFSRIVDLFAVSNFLKKTDIFSWFVNECIPSILNEIKESDEESQIPSHFINGRVGEIILEDKKIGYIGENRKDRS
ncbi:MAG: hypothetical protein IIC67_07130 [Thaumarchaeota archaeon]|nr:hypothetical protein [Nitrososphaerota archaeon]